VANETNAWRAYTLSDGTILLQEKGSPKTDDEKTFISVVYGDRHVATLAAEEIVDKAIDALEDRYCD
jgi:uncharacterized protein YifE (UPF0438 family)